MSSPARIASKVAAVFILVVFVTVLAAEPPTGSASANPAPAGCVPASQPTPQPAVQRSHPTSQGLNGATGGGPDAKTLHD